MTGNKADDEKEVIMTIHCKIYWRDFVVNLHILFPGFCLSKLALICCAQPSTSFLTLPHPYFRIHLNISYSIKFKLHGYLSFCSPWFELFNYFQASFFFFFHFQLTSIDVGIMCVSYNKTKKSCLLSIMLLRKLFKLLQQSDYW